MRVIKRKKGNEEYFYLQHSFRKGKKVVTKEAYLGKEIPENIEEIKEKLRHESKKELYEKLERIKESFQEEWGKIPESVKEKEKEEIAIAFTYNSNAIEGSTITLEEAREIIHDKIAVNKPIKDIKETEAHSKLFLKILDKKEKLSKTLLLRWHKEIFEQTKEDIAGRFRDYLVRVGEYTAPDWQDVEGLMNQFIRFTNKEKLNPAELAARAHYKFEKIHPFGDGNGRIGRLIMNYILWHNKCPMLIIEYKKRRSYYKALQKDEEKFVDYFLRRYISVHKKRIASH
ncbi:Fic family protein [Candidatus Pacearchaeota archaeon]|nr:Fic family protein [Candidatus Pacearchaeota archaeon]